MSFLFTGPADFNSNLTAPLPTILDFLPNEHSMIFSVWSVQDEITEGTECFHFSLEPVDEFVIVPSENTTVTICIEDDDGECNEDDDGFVVL